MQLELDGLPASYYETLLDRYRAVTPKDIQRVAQKYLHPDQLTIFVVGDTKQTRAALGKLGKVTEVPLEATPK
jgi:predicted Zn-dependent peptidase